MNKGDTIIIKRNEPMLAIYYHNGLCIVQVAVIIIMNFMASESIAKSVSGWCNEPNHFKYDTLVNCIKISSKMFLFYMKGLCLRMPSTIEFMKSILIISKFPGNEVHCTSGKNNNSNGNMYLFTKLKYIF